MPIRSSPAAAAASPVAPPPFVADASTDAALLIVDDRPENLLVLEAVLEPLGVRLVRAGSGHEALARVEEEDYAAVLLDVHMPGIDGFETARAIRARDRSRAAADAGAAPTPILFLTAGDVRDRARLAEAYALGAVDVIGKPLDPEAVCAKAQVFVDLARARVFAARSAAARALERAELERVRAAEAALRASEERYRFLAETMPVMVWTARPDGELDYVSEQAARVIGRSAAELMGEGWGAAVHPDDAARVRAGWARAVAGAEAYGTEFRIWCAADRSYRWHLARAVPRRDAAGRVIAWVGTNTDVEDQKRAADERRQLLADEQAAREEAQAKRRAAEEAEERARRLQQATAALTTATTPEEVARVIAEECARALDGVASTVARLADDGETIEIVGTYGFATGRFGPAWRLPLSADVPLTHAIRGGQFIWVESPEAGLARYPEVTAMREVGRAGAWVAFPLLYNGAVLGSVGLVLRGARAASTADEEFLGALAPLCAQALERARLYAAEREARRTAQLAEARMAEVFTQAPVAVCVMRGPDLVYELANARYRELLNGRELLGRRVAEAIPELGAEVRAGLDRVIATGVPFVASELCIPLDRDGDGAAESYFFNLVYHPIVEGGGAVTGLVMVAAEVTEQVLGRQVAERLQHEAERARAGAEAANRAKSEFLSTMSHELRTPLNAIGGYVDLMELGIRGPVTEAQREDLARIKRSSQHLLSLINDILNFARLEAGQVDFRIADVPVDDVVRDVEGLIAPQVAAKQLSYAHGAAAGLVVRADPERLRQVLLNLLTNAVKFTEPGGRLSLACAPDGDLLRIRVSDTGRGIPSEQLTRIFEPFVQVDRHLTHASQQGVGLGLAISRDLARRMGGELDAESEVGVGSVFTLTLPRG